MREKFFQSLGELKFTLEYISILIRNNNKAVTRMNIFLALSSSTAIAGWAIFSGKGFIIWAMIIGLSQVITVIRPQISIDKWSKALPKLEVELMSIFLEMKKLWFDVDNGLIEDKKIHEILCGFDESSFATINKHLEGARFDNIKIKTEADSKANYDLVREYGGIINE